MKNWLLILLVGIIAIGIGGVGGYKYNDWQKIRAINSFEECARYFPVAESYPAQCTANGKHFTQNISAKPQSVPDPKPQNTNITVTSPLPNTQISSPLTITGSAVGSWYFEASFPIKLYDANNNLIAQTTGQAQGNWMTTSFVPFTATLTFPTPSTTTGTLVLEKDNPSGEPQNADSISIPVTF